MPIVAIVCAVIFVPWNAAYLWIAPLPDTVQAQLDTAVDHGIDGIIVYIDQPGEAPALYAAGWNNRAEKVPADPQALFKIGSMSKLYIATATAKLVNDGRLSLDDTLADHLPELVGRIENADRITLRMMLQHRSGIPNFTDHPDYPWFETLPDRNAYLGFALDRPADFEPDSRYRYSNTNYLLIGTILDNVLGYSHQQYIHSEILEPLGLTHTYRLLSQVDTEAVVSGYHDDVEPDLVVRQGLHALIDMEPGMMLVDEAQASHSNLTSTDTQTPSLQKMGGLAGIIAALTFLFGFALFVTTFEPLIADDLTSVETVEFLKDNQTIFYM